MREPEGARSDVDLPVAATDGAVARVETDEMKPLCAGSGSGERAGPGVRTAQC